MLNDIKNLIEKQYLIIGSLHLRSLCRRTLLKQNIVIGAKYLDPNIFRDIHVQDITMYSIELDRLSHARAKMKLYRNVTNVPELRQRVLSGELQCSLIKPSLIIDPFQVVVAANKAVTANKIKTRTLYTEILFNLSVSKNITQSLQTFGISDNDKNVLVVVIEKNEDSFEDIFKNVQGEEIALEALRDISNTDLIKKVYKLSDTEIKHDHTLDSVVSKIAAKDCIL